ncbi:two-component system, OmpR family, phosphate regulon sensor histidine kinase PhoR [Marininema mesophilum]|uniref:histidine kinase n=1 Tax=Marininema mesophilum TaxID=1048340 RepID=A0A1H2XUY5_9BACL|nr:ATP-binding protein [Marininema mesophilum]SDW96129.1 two-component system, OmpR family, phosphate regulon sensor histidine kinase PhoR [Marininema mesophilum]
MRGRLFITFLWLTGLSVLITGLFVSFLMKAAYTDSLGERMGKEGQLLAKSLDWESTTPGKANFRRQTRLYGQTLGAHVTLLDGKGNVLSDSHQHQEKNTDLKKIPAVKRILQKKEQGSFERVVTNNQLAVYVPVDYDGVRKGALRITVNLGTINHSLRQVWVSMIIGLVLAYTVAAFVSSRLASRITRPIEEITQVAVDVARNKYHRRIPVKKQDEIGRLATAINRMAAGLRYQLETIRKSERRLTGVIETMESGLLMVDSEEKITVANQAMQRLFDLGSTSLINKFLSDFPVFHELHGLVNHCKESRESVRDELHLYFPTERILEASLTPIWGGETVGMGVVIVLHDITPIRYLEKLRTEFVANVSHELKTPVTSLRGFAETLLDGAVDDPAMRREFLEIIHHESLRLERLIGDLLDLSKIESRKVRLQVAEVIVDDLIRPTVRTMEEELRKKDLQLHIKGEQEFVVRVDPDRFSQIVINLVANAMAYTPAGGSITVTTGLEETSWWLQVEDTGVGIPSEDLPRIFERFYRVDKARSRDSGGTGLGLAIVKHLVEAHRGTIDVESQVGKKTVFTLRFPR